MTEGQYAERRSYSLSFNAKKDADVIAFLDGQPNMTETIRRLVRGRLIGQHTSKQLKEKKEV